MVVDDSETNQVLLEALLAGEGWTVRTASSATLAMEMLKTGSADLILLDLLMPGVDGLKMLDLLKSDSRLSNIPVIVVSAVSDKKTRDLCLEKGAVDYMSKPVRINEIVKKVRDTLL